ncbi:helix-hairpin-helix domain-containing protein [Ancylomarina euxinus]|uniref:helix-hairpin-helix domain-containing protein n=1 Tax=Ancylomarina euxinus TaxID=2283627 RepID=UPI0013153D2B|nr:helix-hairpin-helix domain-containing protein [Ancylomarina euxinus]MCZ4693970.1 helix-hairpin-helix domain-containing protein [Ancylomarina euxinus]
MIILLTILAIVFVYPIFINSDNVPVWDKNPEKQKRLDSLLAVLQIKSDHKQEAIKSHELFFFDPNHIDSLGLLSLGFSNYQAKNLLKYRRSGARVSEDVDLKKIYGMTDVLYLKLQPFVRISPEKNISCSIVKAQLRPFDPNKTDSLALLSLGFSKFQTRNILNYRRKDGWFNKKDDLMNIYGIDSSDYKRFEKYIRIDSGRNVNESYLFSFNPNSISRKGWDSLGVEERVIDRVKKFLAKGGRFQKAEDLKIIYGFDSLKYSELHSFISIPNERAVEIALIDLNRADSIQLLRLPGIGPYLSRRIINYRDKLGGFYSMNQLVDVYGLKKSRVDSICSSLKIDLSHLRCINVNVASIEELSIHPYISYREASDILRLRKRKGRILDLESLRKKKIFQDSTFNRVKPYLSLE